MPEFKKFTSQVSRDHKRFKLHKIQQHLYRFGIGTVIIFNFFSLYLKKNHPRILKDSVFNSKNINIYMQGDSDHRSEITICWKNRANPEAAKGTMNRSFPLEVCVTGTLPMCFSVASLPLCHQPLVFWVCFLVVFVFFFSSVDIKIGSI